MGSTALLRRLASREVRLYLDMDGVLADYERGADAAGIPYNRFKDTPGCYLNLEPIPGALEAVKALLASVGDSLYILSTPPSKRHAQATEEKRQWLSRVLPEFPLDHALFVQNKAGEGIPGDVLVDDHPEWNGAAEFPGEVIHFRGPETWEDILDRYVSHASRVAAASPALEGIASEFLRFLDPMGRLPLPTIKIQNNAASGWLGRCAPEGVFDDHYTVVSARATIYLQKTLLGAPEDLKRVIAHEVAHYYAFATKVLGKVLQDYNDIVTKDNKEGGHGEVWQAVVQRINSAYGKDYVTLTSDQSYTTRAKAVNLFIMRQADRMDWCWSSQIPARVVEFMAGMNRAGVGVSCFIGNTDDPHLVVNKAKATNANQGWATPWLNEQVSALEEAWTSQPNRFADLASGVDGGVTQQRAKTWTLVMANPYREDSPRYSAHPALLAAWKLGRTLTEHEKDIISQLNAIGLDTRFTRINNDDALFRLLPQVNLNDIVHNRGLNANAIMDPGIQDRLLAAWPKGDRPVKQKTAKLFTRQAAGAWIDDGEGTDAVVRADIPNHLGPEFQIVVRPSRGGDLQADIHVIPKDPEDDRGDKPFVLHAPFRESDLATASDLVLQIREVINQEYSALAYPLRQQGKRKQLHDLLMEGNLTYQKVMADLIPNLTHRPAPRWNGWAGAKTSAPVTFPDALIRQTVAQMVSELQEYARSGNSVTWDRMVRARRVWCETDLAPLLEEVYPGITGVLGSDKILFVISVSPVTTGRPYGSAGIILEDLTILCEMNPLQFSGILDLSPDMIGWLEGSLRHELTHLLHMALQGREAYADQKRQEQTGPRAYPDVMDEVKASSATLAAEYRKELATTPELSVETFLRRNAWWQRNHQDFSPQHQQRIYKDLAYVKTTEGREEPAPRPRPEIHVSALGSYPPYGGNHREGTADGPRFGGGGSGGYPIARCSHLISMAASAWDADTSRMHYREDHSRVRYVQNALRHRFQQLLDMLHVQPGGRSMTLRQFLQRNPLTALFQSTDQSVRLMGNRIRQEMNHTLHQEFTPADVQQFKDSFGSNVTDWFTHKIIARTAGGALASIRTARLSDPSLIKRYHLTPEQLALAKAVDSGDYLEWVVKQMVGVKPRRPNLTYEEANTPTPAIRLPEDTEKLRGLLEAFTKLKRSPKFTGSRDINAYTPGDLFTLRDESEGQMSNKEQVRTRRDAAVAWEGTLDFPGLGQVDVETLKVTDPKAAMEISGGPSLTQDGTKQSHTNWCTTQQSYATQYTDQGPLWVVKVDGLNYAQLHNETGQLLDAKDEAFPEQDIPGVGTVVLDSVVNEALGRAGAFAKHSGYTYLDVANASPELLVRYYAPQDVDIPDDIMARIEKDPRALALLSTLCNYQMDSADLDLILSDIEATAVWAQKWLRYGPSADLFDRGEVFAQTGDPEMDQMILQKLQQAMDIIASNPFESEKFLVWYLSLNSTSRAWGGKFPEPQDQPKWFQKLVESVKSDAGSLYRLAVFAPRWPGIPEALLEKDFSLALKWYISAMQGRPWGALQQAIVDHGDQRAACEYLRRAAVRLSGVAVGNPLFDLALREVPQDKETMWAAEALIMDHVRSYQKSVPAGTPFPDDWASSMYPPAADQIVWASKNSHLLALWAAMAYQDDPQRLQQALQAFKDNGQAATTYLEAADYALTPELEPALLELLHNGGSIWFALVARYVTKNYDSPMQGRHGVVKVLEQAISQRSGEPVAV